MNTPFRHSFFFEIKKSNYSARKKKIAHGFSRINTDKMKYSPTLKGIFMTTFNVGDKVQVKATRRIGFIEVALFIDTNTWNNFNENEIVLIPLNTKGMEYP